MQMLASFAEQLPAAAYYADKIATLRDLFGTTAVWLESGDLIVDGRRYPIVDDVIVLLDPSEYPRRLKQQLGVAAPFEAAASNPRVEAIRESFGDEWTAFPEMLPEHEAEFHRYFDLVDLSRLAGCRLCDLGCGMGRWSAFLSARCREIVLVDFSDAIFTARRNLDGTRNALFFMADLTRLPFRDNFADWIVCLGVLHHLTYPALTAVRMLERWTPRMLVYLYYALDNRPRYFRPMLGAATAVRLALSTTIRNPARRAAVARLLAGVFYSPMIALGGLLGRAGLGRYVPLHETYAGKSHRRICQDAYDRFFTRIEQRHTKLDILRLRDTFSKVIVSEHPPFWHFVCER